MWHLQSIFCLLKRRINLTKFAGKGTWNDAVVCTSTNHFVIHVLCDPTYLVCLFLRRQDQHMLEYGFYELWLDKKCRIYTKEQPKDPYIRRFWG